MRAMDLDIEKREDVANDRLHRRFTLRSEAMRGETGACHRREACSKGGGNNTATSGESVFVCIRFHQDCHTQVGLNSHNRYCDAIGI